NCILITATLLHYFTPIVLERYHEIFRRLYYIPIILGSFWFGFRGGVIVSFLSALLYAPHVFFQWGATGLVRLDQYLEIIMYIVIGIVTGVMADKEKEQRIKAEEVSRELAESYDKLHIQAQEIFEKEQQLLRADRFSTMGELAASLAHEIRNPLGSILGSVEILSEDIHQEDKKYEFFQIIVTEANRLNRVINDFLSFAKTTKPVIGKFNINEAVEDIKSLVELGSVKKNITFDLSLDDTINPIDGDAEQIKQAFLNILLNSVQAMKEGGILTIHTLKGRRHFADDEFDIKYSIGKDMEGEFISVIFGDTGEGISEEDIDKIFNPFFTKKENGTGLGLAITKRIIISHNGAIEVFSKKGKGTYFVVMIPQ
ncbi:MAG: sensor histidine kinase, partial [Candidatus Schekmanbacteria bacterium]